MESDGLGSWTSTDSRMETDETEGSLSGESSTATVDDGTKSAVEIPIDVGEADGRSNRVDTGMWIYGGSMRSIAGKIGIDDG